MTSIHRVPVELFMISSLLYFTFRFMRRNGRMPQYTVYDPTGNTLAESKRSEPMSRAME